LWFIDSEVSVCGPLAPFGSEVRLSTVVVGTCGATHFMMDKKQRERERERERDWVRSSRACL
jgi:hypothetical protein